MHSVTKGVASPFMFAKVATGGMFIGHLEVNRTDFKIGNSDRVGELVKIDLKVPVGN